MIDVIATIENHDFDDRAIAQYEHRPWPVPAAPWIMTQTWHDLLFARVPTTISRSRVFPACGIRFSERMGRVDWLFVDNPG